MLLLISLGEIFFLFFIFFNGFLSRQTSTVFVPIDLVYESFITFINFLNVIIESFSMNFFELFLLLFFEFNLVWDFVSIPNNKFILELFPLLLIILLYSCVSNIFSLLFDFVISFLFLFKLFFFFLISISSR